MAKQKQNEMKEHILESLHSILMNRHFNKTSFVSTKEKEAGAEANCDPAKTYSSFHACRINEKPRPCNWDSLKICEYDHGSDFSGAWHV